MLISIQPHALRKPLHAAMLLSTMRQCQGMQTACIAGRGSAEEHWRMETLWALWSDRPVQPLTNSVTLGKLFDLSGHQFTLSARAVNSLSIGMWWGLNEYAWIVSGIKYHRMSSTYGGLTFFFPPLQWCESDTHSVEPILWRFEFGSFPRLVIGNPFSGCWQRQHTMAPSQPRVHQG